MPFSLDVDDQVDAGDTKELRVTPTAPDGSALSLSTLDLVVDEPNGESTFAIGDFTQDGNDYVLNVGFPDVGSYELKLTAEGSQGVPEVEREQVYAHSR